MDEHRTGTHYKRLNSHLPQESVGRCKNALKCLNTNVDLGNGYCMKCYDKGLDKAKSNREEVRKERIERVLKLKLQKLNSREISVRLGVSTGTIFGDLRYLRGMGNNI